jgi:hypothetical protein
MAPSATRPRLDLGRLALLWQAAAGNRPEQDRLFSVIASDLKGMLCCICARVRYTGSSPMNSYQPDDLLQVCWLVLWRHALPGFRPGRGKFSTWASMVCKRKLLDLGRLQGKDYDKHAPLDVATSLDAIHGDNGEESAINLHNLLPDPRDEFGQYVSADWARHAMSQVRSYSEITPLEQLALQEWLVDGRDYRSKDPARHKSVDNARSRIKLKARKAAKAGKILIDGLRAPDPV